MDHYARGRPTYTFNRALSSSSPKLESSTQDSFALPTLDRRRFLGDSSPHNANRNSSSEAQNTTHDSNNNNTSRPPVWTSNSYNGPYQESLGSRSTSPMPSAATPQSGHKIKKSGGGSFAQSRKFSGAPPLHITVSGQAGTEPPRLNTARLGANTPLWSAAGQPGTPGVFPPTSLSTASIAKRVIRSRTSLVSGIGLLILIFSMYFTTYHPEASGALYKSAKAPLASAANAAKAAIKGGGATGADMQGESWKDLLGFGGDLLDMNSWGLLNSGRDRDGNLPLSPWYRYKETWNRHREDAILKQVVPEQHDGRVLIEEGKPHPIPALMARAKKRWEDLNNRQSKTFAQAVAEYQRRYGRRPPRGFDRWYAFARANNVKLIDEFDLIEHSLRPFRAFEPASFRRRASKAASIINSWRIRVTRGQMYREGELGHHERAQGILQMCKKFKHELPDMIIGYNGHDGARVNIGWEERMRLEDLIEDGIEEEYLPKDSEMAPVMESPPPGWGIPQTCPTDSKMRENGFEFGDPDKRMTGLEVQPAPSNGVGSLVGGFKEYLDVCNSPQYRHFHAATSWSFQTWPTTVMPLFTPGVHARFGDVYCVIDEQFRNDAPEGLSWDKRKHDKAVWRGQASGPFYEASTPWQSTQRPRLHLLTHSKKGTRDIVFADKDGLAKRKAVKKSIVNPLFFDAGIVGPAVQCSEEDGTCDKMGQVFSGFDDRLSFEDQEEYKYQLDVDGNSWSGRFRRLMLSNGAVLKATIFQEFWTDWAIPWLHFIPLQVDYSDIYDVMAFFRGGPNGENGHDELAREIAMAGKSWAKAHMRWEDIEAYTFRQFLEYGRLYNADRDDMDFVLEVADYEPVWYH